MRMDAKKLCIAGAAFLSLGADLVAQGRGSRPAPPPPPRVAGPPVTVSGKINQFNFNRDGAIEGFLLGENTLVHLPPPVASFVGPALHSGDAVEVAGNEDANASGIRTIEAREVNDRTLHKVFSVPQPGPAAPYSGSGRVQQLNYSPAGSINGFLLDNGTLLELPPFAASNPTSIRAGVPVTFAGYARSSAAGRTVVELQSLSFNGQTLTLRSAEAADAPSGPPSPPPPGRAPGHGPGELDEPTPPPPPPGPPQQG